MKNFITTLIIAATLTLSACKSETEHGECIGITDAGHPDLNYKLRGRNLAWSIIGFETLFAPVLWATDFAMCPVSTKLQAPNFNDKPVALDRAQTVVESSVESSTTN